MGRPRDYSREGKGDWAAPAELADEAGCPGAWYRTAFVGSILRYYRRRDRNGNRIENPLLTRCTDELVIEAVRTIEGYEDAASAEAEVAAIKAKTDSLTFTVAGVLDANVQRINDVVITGNGQVGTEFGV